jgi:hypothetical protein
MVSVECTLIYGVSRRFLRSRGLWLCVFSANGDNSCPPRMAVPYELNEEGDQVRKNALAAFLAL